MLSGSSPFSIEATEVSVAQYNLFKARYPAPTSFPRELCPQKMQLGPPATTRCNSTASANTDPMTCVDWCDANAYCTAIGRHLCGDMADGGALAVAKQNNAGSDEWFYACRGPDAGAYPYGSSVQTGACNNNPSNALVPVGTMPRCEGAESGLFDMSGNAAEWIASCVPGACAVRGGSYKFSASDSTCALTLAKDPQTAFPDTGFRCCAEP